MLVNLGKLTSTLFLSLFIIYNSQNYFLSIGLDQKKIRNFKNLKKNDLITNRVPKSEKIYIISQNTYGRVSNI